VLRRRRWLTLLSGLTEEGIARGPSHVPILGVQSCSATERWTCRVQQWLLVDFVAWSFLYSDMFVCGCLERNNVQCAARVRRGWSTRGGWLSKRWRRGGPEHELVLPLG
jgi:hypothetical protein